MLKSVIEIVREAAKYMNNREFDVHSKGSVSNNLTTVDLAVQNLNKMLYINIFIMINKYDFIKSIYI